MAAATHQSESSMSKTRRTITSSATPRMMLGHERQHDVRPTVPCPALVARHRIAQEAKRC